MESHTGAKVQITMPPCFDIVNILNAQNARFSVGINSVFVLQTLDGRAIRVDEAGKGGRSRGGFGSGPRGGRFSGSRGRGGRGYSRGENQMSVNML